MRLAAVLLLALVAVAAHAQPAAPTLEQRFERDVTSFTLANGMTFVVAERHEAPVVTFFTVARVGGADEPAGQTGVAHLFEHMAFKGTTTLGTRGLAAETAALAAEEAAYLRLRAASIAGDAPDSLRARFVALRDTAATLVVPAAFDALVSRHGAVGLNATTSADRTAYFYSLPANKVELWFNTESDRFQNPVLREFYQERDVVMEERRLRTESSPTGRLVEEFLAAAFLAHPYGQPVVGHMSDLAALSRTEAQAFFDRYYGPANLTVAIVGDVQPDQVRALAERYFGPMAGGQEVPHVRTVEPEQRGERRVTVVDRAQPVVFVGHHRPSASHPDEAVYTLLLDLLATGRTSRFYRALVEPGLAVAAQPLDGFPGERYPSLVGYVLVPAPGVAPDSLEAAAARVVDELVRGGVTDAELSRARTRARAGLVAALDSRTGLASALAQAQALDGDWRTVFRRLDALDAVTPADVQRVAGDTFRATNRTVATLQTAADG